MDANEETKIVEDIDFTPKTKVELMKMLDEMIASYEQLPPMAMTTAINHYDLMSVLLLVRSIFHSKES